MNYYNNTQSYKNSAYVINDISINSLALNNLNIKVNVDKIVKEDKKSIKNKINCRHMIDFLKDDLGVSYYENELNGFHSQHRFKALDLIILSIVNSYIVNKFNKDYNNQTIVINNKALQDFLGNTRIKTEKLVAICDRLVSNKISFGNRTNVSFFTKAKYENGNFYLVFNKELAGNIINRKNYTKVDNHQLFKLYRESNNAEAIRLYQYMATFNGIIYQNKDCGKNDAYRFKKDFTYKELCDILCISGSDVATVITYNRDRNRDRIIQNAITRINNSTNMILELNYDLISTIVNDKEEKILTNSIYMDIHFTQYDKARPYAIDYFENEINECNRFGYVNYARMTANGTQLKDLFDYLKKNQDLLKHDKKTDRFMFTNGRAKDKVSRKFIHLFTDRLIEDFNPISTKTFHFSNQSKIEKYDRDYQARKIKIASSKNDISYLLLNLSDQYRKERFSGKKFGVKKVEEGKLSV